jgi:O-antigen/teichoic acid export membrane protein
MVNMIKIIEIFNINKEKIFVLSARFVEICGMIIFLKLISNLLMPEDLGLYFLAASLISFSATIFFNPLDQGFFRNSESYIRDKSHSKRYSSSLILNSFMALIIGTVVVLVGSYFNKGVQNIFLLLLFWLVFDVIKNFNIIVATALRDRKYILVSTSIDYCGRFLLLSFFWVKLHINLEIVIGIISFAIISNTSYLLICYRKKLSYIEIYSAKSTFFDSLNFCWPMMVWGIFGWAQAMSGRWFLDSFVSLEVVAIYGIMVSLATLPVNAIVGVATTYLYPIIYQIDFKNPAASKQYILRTILYLIPPCFCLLLFTYFYHSNIIELFSSPKYSLFSQYLPLMLLASLSSGLSSILCGLSYVKRHASSLLFANIIPGMCAFIFGYFLIERFQLKGAVIIFVVVNFIASFLYIVAFIKQSMHLKTDIA